MTSSPSPPDIGSLSLSPQRTQPPHDLYDYDNSNGRSPYHYQTSPPVIPGQPLYANANSFSMAQTPIKAAKPSRAALPSQWLENSPSQLNDSRSMSPPSNSEISSGGGSPPRLGNLQNQTPYTPAGTGPEDEIIPTAIVIKNIPFNVKRETLLDIIASLNIPTPYAFNYHLDPAGAFRGLAFANFRLPADADAVVAALNGFDVQGRKLRVEYKKVLQAGEKERIEREKAIRRMRSMQLEKEQQQQMQQPQYDEFGPVTNSLYTPRSVSGVQSGPSPPFQQHSPPQAPPPIQNRPFLASSAQIQPQPILQTPSKSTSTELDLNDPSTLEIYSRILLFKDDHMRDELAFSRTLSPKQRRVVHLVAQKLGVYHYSVGEGDERYAVVTRIDPESRRHPQQLGARHGAQTLSRASSSYLQTSSHNQTSASSALRSKKSMPDMKTLHTTGPRLGTRASNGNLREYATIASPSRRTPGGFGALFGNGGGGAFGNIGSNIPPVPTLPAGLGNGSLNDGPMGGVMRQPRGPGEGGFGQRRVSAATPTDIQSRGLEARSHEPLEI